WHANPSGDPNGPEEAIWAARTAAPGVSWRVVEGSNPQLSPDGHWVLVVKDGQIHRAAVSATKPATEMDRGEKPFISEWGTNSSPVWSPDGTKIAFVSNRGDHSFAAAYHAPTRPAVRATRCGTTSRTTGSSRRSQTSAGRATTSSFRCSCLAGAADADKPRSRQHRHQQARKMSGIGTTASTSRKIRRRRSC